MDALNFTEEQLTHPEAVLCWFADPIYDLENLGKSPEEKAYLREIDKIARKTGASNIALCEYIWSLENRLEQLANNHEQLANNVEAMIEKLAFNIF